MLKPSADSPDCGGILGAQAPQEEEHRGEGGGAEDSEERGGGRRHAPDLKPRRCEAPEGVREHEEQVDHGGEKREGRVRAPELGRGLR